MKYLFRKLYVDLIQNMTLDNQEDKNHLRRLIQTKRLFLESI